MIVDMESSCQLVVASVSSGVYHNFFFSFSFFLFFSLIFFSLFSFPSFPPCLLFLAFCILGIARCVSKEQSRGVSGSGVCG